MQNRVYVMSERSERDTFRGKNEKIGDVCLFIYMDVCMSFCTLTLRIFVFAPRSTPSQTSLNRILGLATITRISPRKLELFRLELFCGCS